MIEWIKENATEIMMYLLMFTMGFGAGGAIADAINGWGCENEKHNDSDT